MSNTSSEVSGFLDSMGQPSVWGRPLTEDQTNILLAAVAAGYTFRQIAVEWRAKWGWGSPATLRVRYRKLVDSE